MTVLSVSPRKSIDYKNSGIFARARQVAGDCIDAHEHFWLKRPEPRRLLHQLVDLPLAPETACLIGRNRIALAALASFFAGGSLSPAADPSAPQRGKQALLGRSFNPATISFNAYRSAWREWGNDLKEPPARYTAAFMERYGLHAAPYPNNGYPMGLREGRTLFGAKALSTDCLLCHGGSICGQSYVGLGNTALDAQLFFDEMSAADGRSVKTPFRFCNVRGTVEAGGMAVFLFGLREPDLKMRSSRLDLDLHDDLCE